MKSLLAGALALVLAGCASIMPKNPTVSILVDLDPASVDRTVIVESITADRNGMLSPQEASTFPAIGERFQALDKNQDKMLWREEFEAGAKS